MNGEIVFAGIICRQHVSKMEHYKNISLESLPGEAWAPITGFESYYLISSFGRLKSLERYVVFKDNWLRLKGEQIMRLSLNKGYATTCLRAKHKRKQKELHRLVAETFIPNPENKPSVNHKDGVKYNNHVDNLEWATWSEQSIHKYEALNYKNPNSKKIEMIDMLNNVIETFESVAAVNRKYGYNIGNIASYCRGLLKYPPHGYKWKYA